MRKFIKQFLVYLEEYWDFTYNIMNTGGMIHVY